MRAPAGIPDPPSVRQRPRPRQPHREREREALKPIQVGPLRATHRLNPQVGGEVEHVHHERRAELHLGAVFEEHQSEPEQKLEDLRV